MRKKMIVLLAVSVLLAVVVIPAAAITNGEPDGDAHPYVGIMVADVDGEPSWRCSGTLIAPRVFLTAGHCTDEATAARVWFDTDLTDNEDYPYGGFTSIEGTPIPHPDYNWGDSDPHDVGVVILDEPVSDIVPAVLPDVSLLDQLKKDKLLWGADKNEVVPIFKVVGYGRILDSWPPPELTSTIIRRFAESEYVALVPVWLHLSQRAVFEESGTCFGDSGGPAFWINPDGSETLVAVTSTGDAQCVATGLYYRVDMPEIKKWILDQIDSVK